MAFPKIANRTDNPASGITGKRVGPEPIDEADHFYVCPRCGQAVDMRQLGEVFHHEMPGHKRINNGSQT